VFAEAKPRIVDGVHVDVLADTLLSDYLRVKAEDNPKLKEVRLSLSTPYADYNNTFSLQEAMMDERTWDDKFGIRIKDIQYVRSFDPGRISS
jgi:hypothetical protein